MNSKCEVEFCAKQVQTREADLHIGSSQVRSRDSQLKAGKRSSHGFARFVTTGAVKGKGGTILFSQITYKEGGNVTALKLRDIPLAVKWQ
jgi:hypothetical protein